MLRIRTQLDAFHFHWEAEYELPALAPQLNLVVNLVLELAPPHAGIDVLFVWGQIRCRLDWRQEAKLDVK
jgi:hypothetical protein